MNPLGQRTLVLGSILAASLLAAVPLAAGVFGPEAYPSWKAGGMSQKLNPFTFYEADRGLKVFAGVEVSRFHDDETFFPLQVAVGNGNAASVTLTREEFVLTDNQGVYYPLAEHAAISAEYQKSLFDQTLVERSEFLGNKFVGFDQIPSLFFPNPALRGVRNDKIQLPKGTYLSDVLYFRKPTGPLEGRVFTLTVYFPQQERQIDVKFALPGEPRKQE
jgi:hypothetical protein